MMKLLQALEELLPVLIFVGIVVFRIWSAAREAAAERAAQAEAEAEERRREGLAPRAGAGRRELEGSRDRSRDEDAEAAERRRRLQEEIRRRIEQAASGTAGDPMAAPPPLPPPPPAPRPDPVRTPPPVAVPVPLPTRDARRPVVAPSTAFPQAIDPTATIQRMMREAEEQARLEAEAQRTRAAARRAVETKATPKATVALPALAADFRDPRSARRAVIAAEVLGPPLANRPEAGPLLPALSA